MKNDGSIPLSNYHSSPLINYIFKLGIRTTTKLETNKKVN